MNNTMNFEEIKKYIEDNYIIIEYNNGHVKSIGRDANIYKNPFWKVKQNDNDNENETILMYCELTTFIKLCPESYKKILMYEKNNDIKITWFKASNGYVVGNNKLFIHQIITGCYGNGKGTSTVSVDHIDQEVEKWLSNKITEKYFNEHKNYDYLEFNKYKDDSLRGTLLGGGYFLDEIVKIGCGHITINCGS
jgi:hypothetical protein